MKNFLILVGLLFFYASCDAKKDTDQITDPKTKPAATYTLDWSDEFNVDGKPDSMKWTPEIGLVRNQELQYYQLNNAYCSNGLLIIEGRRERVANPQFGLSGVADWIRNTQYADYTSASLTTSGKKTFSYGRIEVKAKICTDPGAWPAIWTWGTSAGWPSAGEIDILEFYRPKPNLVPTIFANFCWGDTWTRTIWNSKTKPLSYFVQKDPDWANKFHVWRMDWNESEIDIYLDGELMNTNLSTVTNQDGVTKPFLGKPMTLILNLAIGSNGGDPSVTQFPLKYEVDYVRYYKRN